MLLWPAQLFWMLCPDTSVGPPVRAESVGVILPQICQHAPVVALFSKQLA